MMISNDHDVYIGLFLRFEKLCASRSADKVNMIEHISAFVLVLYMALVNMALVNECSLLKIDEPSLWLTHYVVF
jgi:hypothetical protein